MLLGLRELIAILMNGSHSSMKFLSQVVLTTTALLSGLCGPQLFGDVRGGLDFYGSCWFLKVGTFHPSSHSEGLSQACISLSYFVSSSSYIAGFLTFLIRGSKSFILPIKGEGKAELMKLRRSGCVFPATCGKKYLC